jgi:hypothetical protein
LKALERLAGHFCGVPSYIADISFDHFYFLSRMYRLVVFCYWAFACAFSGFLGLFVLSKRVAGMVWVGFAVCLPVDLGGGGSIPSTLGPEHHTPAHRPLPLSF